MKRLAGFLVLLCSLILAGSATAQSGTKNEVLILDSSVTGGLASAEAAAVTLAGFTPVMTTDAALTGRSTAQLSTYRALVIGDRNCIFTLPPGFAAAAWGSAVTGPGIIIGTDPTLHSGSRPGALQLIRQGIAFAASDPLKLGAYITLSCYYHSATLGTAVPALAQLGGPFTVMGASLVANKEDSHIVATHPALVGLLDTHLANWNNSVHNGFQSWPTTWKVLAITKDPTGPFTAGDKTKGYPYILATGEGLVSVGEGTLTLGPEKAENPVGSKHEVTATFLFGGSPQAGVVVTFTIVSGPHAGLTGTATTNSAGQATWYYPGTLAGDDVIEATATVREVRYRSRTVNKTWIADPTDPCCATLKVQPFPDPPTNNDVRTFTITNPVKSPICYVEIRWSPAAPASYTGGGPGTASYGGILVDSQVEPSAGAWFSFPYQRIPKTGTFAGLGPFSLPLPAGAKDEIAFNLGVDYTIGWTGFVQIAVHYCDGTICRLEYGPWTPRPPSEGGPVDGPKARQLPGDPKTVTFEFDTNNSANATKWVGFSVGSGSGLMVSSGTVRGGRNRERAGAVGAQLAPHGLRPNSALFVLPEGASTSQFDVRVTGEGRNPQVRWTTYGEDGAPQQTGTVPPRGGREEPAPSRPPQRN